MNSGLRVLLAAGLVCLPTGCYYHGGSLEKHGGGNTPILSDTGPGFDVRTVALLPPWKERQRNTSSSPDAKDSQPSIYADDADRWLVYVSTSQSNNPKLFLKDPAGAAIRQLTYGLSSDLFPRFSPDGKWIAFASDRNGNWDIYVIHRDQPVMVRQVTFSMDDDIAPSWSPDGKKLAYCSKDASGGWSLWIADLQTGGFTNLGPGMFPAWSPNPEPELQRIAFQKPRFRANHLYGIWTITPDGTQVDQIVHDDRWAAINPSWSMDGRWIAFATVNKSPASWDARFQKADDIWAVRRDGTALTRVTEDPEPEWNPTWGRDRIYFVSGREGRQNIWSVRPVFQEAEETVPSSSGN